ncbi:serine O-acetyltransferase [Vibrio splendidus]
MTSCVISRNLPKSTKIPHPVGIVIGKENGVKIGENCTIMQNVTIGIKKIGDVSGPTIGNNVFIGSNAVIVGDIKVEDNVIIGAGTLVNFDVPKNSKVVNPRCRVKMI